MALAKVLSCAVVGLEGEIVECEVDVSRHGLFNLAIVGLPDAAVKEAKDRVESAVKNSGFRFPQHRTVINLAPADIRKEGPYYDPPIAIGIMVASGAVLADVSGCVFLGELALEGKVRHAAGILPMVALARERGLRTAYVPAIDAPEAAAAGHDDYPAQRSGALQASLRRRAGSRPRYRRASHARSTATDGTDFSAIKGRSTSSAHWRLRRRAAITCS
jgi:magnesium chelatase family protein